MFVAITARQVCLLTTLDKVYTRGNCSGFVKEPERLILVLAGMVLPFTHRWTNPK